MPLLLEPLHEDGANSWIDSGATMHVRDLEQWLMARPFEPFVMRLSDGERIRVNHPDAAIPGRNAVLVINKRRGRLVGFSHVSLFHVVRIDPSSGSTNGRSAKPPSRTHG